MEDVAKWHLVESIDSLAELEGLHRLRDPVVAGSQFQRKSFGFSNERIAASTRATRDSRTELELAVSEKERVIGALGTST